MPSSSFKAFSLLLFALGACSPEPKQLSIYPGNPAISDAQGTPRDTTTFYFPAADSLHATYIPPAKRPREYVLDERVINCAADLQSASYYLTYFQAPVLSNFYLQAPIYRFLWRRSFHRPVLLTLRLHATGGTLHTQLLDKHPGFHTLTVRHPDELAADATPEERAYAKQYYEETMADPDFQAEVAEGKRRARQVKQEETTVSLTLSQCQAFQQRLEQAQFWRLSSCQPEPGLLDGAAWLLEAHLPNRYHMVERRSPDKGTP